ncbi:efflux RND transporter permease subunit [Nitrincola schmidtii]|uniref:efflux RND transporter permease subunit n=1 Tax=Nitrincola schmidtii TaxID=1730894 RepID=UPI00124C1694|nr:efflux RND transporter permease subunit [Nitrincola schmidtii]
MDIARASIDKPVNTWLLVLVCLLGGAWALLTLPQLEDPEFTIKEAVIITPYLGASAKEVELEVTEQLEIALQEMSQLKRVTSRSMPGLSEITVEIKDKYRSDTLPQVWDELRRKVQDTQPLLPPGAGPSRVNDSFGDVFGLFYAVVAPGFEVAELRDFARELRRVALRVPGVAKVVIHGERDERILIEIPQAVLIQLGISPEQLAGRLQLQNAVIDAGRKSLEDLSIRVSPTGHLNSLDHIRNLYITTPSGDTLRLGDVAVISREYHEQPRQLIRYAGIEAVTLGIAATGDSNIVDVGHAVEQALQAHMSELPLGVQLKPIYQQHEIVERALNAFLVNLVISVSIVIIVLCLFMGWRAGVVVGAALLLTVTGSLFLMKVTGLQMQRVSLGALIIAMGMLVDNAIVIAEGMLVRMQKGKTAREAATGIASQTQVPLLAATVIGILAFSGIGLSQDVTGEYTFSLFVVIGLSLLLSWILAITVVPLLASLLFISINTTSDSHSVNQEQQESMLSRHYRSALQSVLRHRRITLVSLLLFTGISLVAFKQVPQMFFPNAQTEVFYVNYWREQGTDIRATDRDLKALSEFIAQLDGVQQVTSVAGMGAARMMLVYQPERTNSAFGQLIVTAQSADLIDELAAQITSELEDYPQAQAWVERVRLGPGKGAPIQARFQGDDPEILRQLAETTKQLFRDSDRLTHLRIDWRQPERVIIPQLAEDRASVLGVSRQDLAKSLSMVTTGQTIGLYREEDRLIPLLLRAPINERGRATQLKDRMIWSQATGEFVPASEVVDQFELSHEEALILRRNMLRTLTVSADPLAGVNIATAFADIRPIVDAIPLPPGYRLEWGGEYESAGDAQRALATQLPLSLLAMVIISVLLFARIKQPLIIWLCVPMAICGVTWGLLATQMSFGFMALLGMLSLSGMLIKNAIVLVDEIDQRILQGETPLNALVEGSVSRLRPVVLAAATTILGMLPLAFDVFFADMAVTIMSGLAFATLLTLLAVPALYSVFFRIKVRTEQQG